MNIRSGQVNYSLGFSFSTLVFIWTETILIRYAWNLTLLRLLELIYITPPVNYSSLLLPCSSALAHT